MCFNSRSPSGLRQSILFLRVERLVFQFTQPKRAATQSLGVNRRFSRFQFTQPKRDATSKRDIALWPTRTFQFTQPKRAATFSVMDGLRSIIVSIHAAQAGCDFCAAPRASARESFNSRSPSGLRLCCLYFLMWERGFNSRSPSGLRQHRRLG